MSKERLFGGWFGSRAPKLRLFRGWFTNEAVPAPFLGPIMGGTAQLARLSGTCRLAAVKGRVTLG